MIFYNNIDIEFITGNCKFHAINLVCSPIMHNIPFHSHGKNCYEIHYISEGDGILNVGGKKYAITPNTLFVTGPLVSHSQITDLNSPMYEWCVYLRTDESGTEKYSDIISRFLSEKFWIGQDGQGLLPLFQKLFSEFENRFDGYLDMAGLLLAQIVVSVTRNYIESAVRTGEMSAGISERTSIIIEEYFLYEYRTASLGELSKRLGFSERQTQRIIKKFYGSSFGEKKNEARMSAAAILLEDEALSLADVSERLGCSSQEHFTTVFKKYYGLSPGRYRKNKFSKL